MICSQSRDIDIWKFVDVINFQNLGNFAQILNDLIFQITKAILMFYTSICIYSSSYIIVTGLFFSKKTYFRPISWGNSIFWAFSLILGAKIFFVIIFKNDADIRKELEKLAYEDVNQFSLPIFVLKIIIDKTFSLGKWAY